MNNLRIALLAGTLGLGGAEKQFYYIARSAQQLQITPVFFTFGKGEYYEKAIREAGIQVRIINGQSRTHQIGNLYSQLADFQPHIIQSCAFYRNLYATSAAMALGTVDIGALRGNVSFELGVRQFWRKLSIYISRSLICNSYNARLKLLEIGVSDDRISMLENVIDLDEFDALAMKAPDSLERYFAVLVARLGKEKRIDRFINAVSIARREILDLKVAIVGEGQCRAELVKLRDGLGLKDNVVFLGQWDNNNIPALLARSSVLVLTSDHEGFPNVILEGMAASLPVISTPAGDVPNVIDDGKTGFLVNYDDIEQIAQLLIKLYRSPDSGKSIGKNARKYIEEKHGINSLSRKLFHIYSKIYQLQRKRIKPKSRADWEKWMSMNSELYET